MNGSVLSATVRGHPQIMSALTGGMEVVSQKVPLVGVSVNFLRKRGRGRSPKNPKIWRTSCMNCPSGGNPAESLASCKAPSLLTGLGAVTNINNVSAEEITICIIDRGRVSQT